MICAECGHAAISDPCPNCGKAVCGPACAGEHLKKHWGPDDHAVIQSAAQVALNGGDEDDIGYHIQARSGGGGTN